MCTPQTWSLLSGVRNTSSESRFVVKSGKQTVADLKATVEKQTPPLVSTVEMAVCLSPAKRRPHSAAIPSGLRRKTPVVMMLVARFH